VIKVDIDHVQQSNNGKGLTRKVVFGTNAMKNNE
jgi:hypothetical protein